MVGITYLAQSKYFKCSIIKMFKIYKILYDLEYYYYGSVCAELSSNQTKLPEAIRTEQNLFHFVFLDSH